MLISIFHSFLGYLSKIIGKKILYTSYESLTSYDAMAVQDNLGFWYVGNLYNSADIAYGIANRSSVESEGIFVKNILDILLTQNSKKTMHFYDIGANTGYFGILAAYISGGRFISHFFEPLTVHTDCIRKSLYLNRLEEYATIDEIGLSNENAEKIFYIAGSGSGLLSDFSGSGAVGTCTISVRKLLDHQKETGLDLPDFVKIDVEGNEYDVIVGGISVFAESKPVLYVEIAKDLKNIGRKFVNPYFDDIFLMLSDIGYQAFHVSDNYMKVTPYISGHEISGVHMYLFLHPDRHNPIISNISGGI